MKNVLGVNVVVLGLVGVASAQQISTRTQLNQILSSGYEYEDAFQAFNIASGSAARLGIISMNSTSTVDGQGPGLLDPGVTYSTETSTSSLQWDGNNYSGSTKQEILSDDNELFLSYTMPVDAMGVDLRAFTGFGQGYTAFVFNGATLVGEVTGTLANDGSTQFFGWENAGGITEVVFDSTAQGWSPIIQEHSYGYAALAPEPASLAALALGGLVLLRRRRA